MKQAQDISVYNYRMMQVMNDPEGGQGIEVKNKLLESAMNNSKIDRKNSVMMDICTAHEAKTKSPPNTQSRSKTNQSHKSEVPENPARKNCCLHLGRTTLEICLLVSIIVNLIFFWYTIWNLLKSADCAEGAE